MIMASNKHIILLFILPLIFATVQSAALCECGLENCESTPLGAMVWQFYCTSHSLRILSWNMVNEHNAVALPAKLDVDNQENISQISQQNNQENISQISQQNNQENSSQISQQNNISQILQQFDFTCKTFTTAMAIKHQLQCSIFNGAYYFNDSNGTLVNMTSEEGIRKLNSTLEYIERLASILQNIEKHITCKQCIVFSPDQYKRLYWNLIDGDSNSVLNTLNNVEWAKPRKYPPEWTNNCRCEIPRQSSCNNFI